MKNIILSLSLFLFSTVYSYAQIPPLFWRYNDKETSENLKNRWIDQMIKMQDRESSISYFKKNAPGYYIDSIKNYNDYILNNFRMNKKYFDKHEAWFLSLLILPDSIKEYVIHHKNTPMEVRAKLGVKSAEDSVIEQFNNIVNQKGEIKNFDVSGFYDLCYNMLYIKSDRTLKAYVKGFGTTAYFIDSISSVEQYEDRIPVKVSILYKLLIMYSTFYKDQKVRDLLKASGLVWINYEGEDSRIWYAISGIKVFFEEIERNIRKQHGIKVKIKTKFILHSEFFMEWMMP